MRIILKQAEADDIRAFLEDNTVPAGLDRDQKKTFILKARRFSLENGVLVVRSNELVLSVVPDDDLQQIKSIIMELHLPNHIGMTKTYYLASRLYVGFSRSHIDNYIRTCESCQRHRPLKRADPIQPIISDFPWERVQVDSIDLRKHATANDGYGWILNTIDTYSKYVYAFPMLSKRASEVSSNLTRLFRHEGPPRELQTDNGAEFVNREINNLCTSLHIRHVRGRPRHPQNQGQIERANQTIVRAISKALYEQDPKRWIDIIDEIVYKYNITRHRATGQTPMQLLKRREGFNTPHCIAAPEPTFATEGETEADSSPTAYDLSEPCPPSPVSEVHEVANPPTSTGEIQLEESTELTEYRLRYITKMQHDADVHFHRTTFFSGDRVLLKKDFDTNTDTRKAKLGGFYEEGIWTVEAQIGASYRITFNGECKTVSKNRITKFMG